MLLARLAETSREVAATRSRIAKRGHIAALLREAPAEEIPLVAGYLSGALRQRRTGVGWRGLSELPEPALVPTVSLAEVDATLGEIAGLSGPGSGTARREMVRGLFSRLTAEEQGYLRGLMTGETRQGALDSVMLDAIAEAAEVPLAEVRRAAMFSAPTGPVAEAAMSGGVEALAAFDLVTGRPVRPMLASSAPDLAEAVEGLGAPYAVDTKLDGIRIQVHRSGDEIAVFTRSLDEVSERLPEVVEAVRALPVTDLILDGEALSVDESGRPRLFQETAASTASSAPGDVRPRPFFFDLLALEGRSLVGAPAAERWALLDEIVPEPMRTARLVTDEIDAAREFYDATLAGGHEGVVLKRLDATYDAGRRGSSWVKVKPRHTLDLVVLAVEWGSGRRHGFLSNIHLGARDGSGFVMLGKTFKGMTDEMLAWQTERFLSLEAGREGHIVHLRPEQVVEIAFDGVQRSTRYPGGVALRFARVLRYRDDKIPAEADTLAAVRAHL